MNENISQEEKEWLKGKKIDECGLLESTADCNLKLCVIS